MAANAAAREERLQAGGGGGTSGGMDPWQTSVEARLGQLHTDVTGLRGDVGQLRVDVARLDEQVKALPGKGFIVLATTTTLGVLGAIILFADQLKALVAG